jgi:hypothetical protein
VHFTQAAADERDARRLWFRDLERLAGLAQAELAPADLELRALFRYHEGDLDGALDSLPTESEDGRLLSDLRRRVVDQLNRRRRQLDERRREATARIESLVRDVKAHGGQRPQKLLADLATLQQEYGELLDASQRREVRAIEETLERGRRRPGVEAVYAPDELVLHPPRDVEMVFRFQREDVGPWERGAWRADGAGWAPPSGPDALNAPGPALALGEPLDLERRMRVTFAFERTGSNEQPTVLALSAAGFHAVFHSDLSDPHGPRFEVDTSGLDEVLARVRRGANPRFERLNGFEMAGRFELTLAVNPRGGTLDGVVLGGRELRAQRQFTSPSTEGGSEIAVRAAGGVRLVAVTVEAERRPD